MTTSSAAKKNDIQKLQRVIVDGLEDVKAQDIVVFDTENLSALFERVIVASGTSNRQTKALAASGGVIQIAAFPSYMIATPKIPERDAAMGALMAKASDRSKMSESDRTAFMAERAAIDAKYPVPKPTFEDFINHMNHAIKVAGIDHVGIGIDFDGGGGVTGLEDASDYSKISDRLLQEGYSREDLAKIWSGNVLRVLRAAEAAKAPAG